MKRIKKNERRNCNFYTSRSSSLTLYHTIPSFNDLKKKPFENVRKEENVGNQHFLLFTRPKTNFKLLVTFNLSSACRLSIWNSLKFCRLVKS